MLTVIKLKLYVETEPQLSIHSTCDGYLFRNLMIKSSLATNSRKPSHLKPHYTALHGLHRDQG